MRAAGTVAGIARAAGRRALAGAAVLALAALVLPACEKIDLDMWENPAYKAQEEPVRLPPADSVPTKGRERIPSPVEARKLANPVPPTEGNVRQGKELFGIFCVPCHGSAGRGDGPVAAKFLPPPVDIGPGSAAARHADGELFLIVTAGSGGMPPFRADLDAGERWKVVAYLRTLR